MINGPGLGRKVEIIGFTYSLTLKRVIAKWAPKGVGLKLDLFAFV